MTQKLVPDEGQEVIIQGFRFTAHNIRILQDYDGREILRFEGRTTDNTLQHTAYNGGVYGHVIGYKTY